MHCFHDFLFQDTYSSLFASSQVDKEDDHLDLDSAFEDSVDENFNESSSDDASFRKRRVSSVSEHQKPWAFTSKHCRALTRYLTHTHLPGTVA